MRATNDINDGNKFCSANDASKYQKLLFFIQTKSYITAQRL